MKWADEEGVDAGVIAERLEAESDKYMAEKEAAFGAETMSAIR